MREPSYPFVDIPARLYRLPTPYEPPAAIAAADSRFFAKVHQSDLGCWSYPKSRVCDAIVMVEGQRFTAWAFAYLARRDEIWPGLRPVPHCDNGTCIRPDHLRLRRPKTAPPSSRALLALVWRILENYRDRARTIHVELHTAAAIAEAYGLPCPQVEAWFFEYAQGGGIEPG